MRSLISVKSSFPIDAFTDPEAPMSSNPRDSNSSSSSSDESEFADASDTLAPLPAPPLPVPSTSYTPHAGRIDISAQSNRRNRLATLRNRMQTEFSASGSSGASGGLGPTEDEVSQSERTSLASWGRNLLMERANEPNVIAVVPADSFSTRASINPNFPAPSHQMAPLVNTPRPVPPPCLSPSSPPPTVPPPPLPDRAGLPVATVSPVPSHGEPRLPPPPLPPRRTPTQVPVTPPRAAETAANFETPRARPPEAKAVVKQVSEVSNTPKNVNLQPPTPTPATPKSTDSTPTDAPSSSMASLTDNYGKKRGHAKTNSLDRGLSLAKSLKSGPWPPPSSAAKSSSLTRGCSPAEMLAVGAICEEDQAAQDVINEIMAEDKDQQMLEPLIPKLPLSSRSAHGELLAVGEESSTKSTPTKLGASKSPDKFQPAQRYENLPDLQSTTSSSQPHSGRTNETTPPTGSSTVSSVPYEPLQSEEPSSSYVTASLTMNSVDSNSSIDPITRDVQRRMSMKTGNEKLSNPTDTPSSSLGHAKSVVKNYGTLASGFFRGALNKARKSIAPGHIPTQPLAPQADYDEGGSDSDENAASVSEPPPPVIPKPSVVEPEYICRPKNQKKGPYDFEQLRVVQELGKEHSGAVWVLKFSVCGRLLATAGQDNIVRVWVLKTHLHHFQKVRDRLNQQSTRSGTSSTPPGPSGSGDFQSDIQDLENAVRNAEERKNADDTSSLNSSNKDDSNPSTSSGTGQTVFAPKPFCVFRGHTADVLDLSWSRNFFVLSCGMDRTVKLWHLARNECLCCFQHMDFVTCIAFMPKDDRYFISGSMDGKIRLWHIPEKKVALWNEVEQVKFITAITFVKNGKFVVVGTYNGRCFFYTTDQLKYHTVIDVRSTRGKNARGHKITSLAVHGDKLLVTSNDSRIRMYDLRDMDMTCKFRGAQIEQSQIRASFSPDGKHIICGSEDAYVYLWRASDFSPSLSVRKDRNNMWERAKVHNLTVTAAIFAPKPQLFLSLLEDNKRTASVSVSSSGAVEPTSAAASAFRNISRFDSDPTEVLVSSHGALSSVHIPSAADSLISQSSTSLANAAIAKQASERQLQGDIIVTADLHGCIKILANPVRIKTGSSHFYVHD
uniref:WD repeat-containing protein 44 n=1 Tax=Panagrellus redivivus TaxID=6233 RepID=A0A7E4ZYC5_PANRE